jgi:hypothetical protein
MDEEAVEPQAELIEQVMDEAQADVHVQEGNDQAERPDKTMVPLSALQKLREKKKELELELQWERQRNAQAQAQAPKPPEDDNSRYESATREDLSRSRDETVRDIEERLWVRQNPEKKQKIDEYLPTFLKQRPNLALAINQAPNRYEEAYTLMEALTPKQQTQLKKDSSPPKKEAPNAPGGVPKAAALNEVADVMNMSDAEFYAWRQSKKKRR